MIECPDCHAVLRPNAKRCACGWVEHSARKPNGPRESLPDSLRWNCIDVDAGHRCAKPGSFSSSTQGGDRWYCADHFPPFRSMRSGQRAQPTEAFRAIVKRMTQPQPVGELIEDQESRLEREAIQAEGNGTMRLGAR